MLAVFAFQNPANKARLVDATPIAANNLMFCCLALGSMAFTTLGITSSYRRNGMDIPASETIAFFGMVVAVIGVILGIVSGAI